MAVIVTHYTTTPSLKRVGPGLADSSAAERFGMGFILVLPI